jgi:hypothetical protein
VQRPPGCPRCRGPPAGARTPVAADRGRRSARARTGRPPRDGYRSAHGRVRHCAPPSCRTGRRDRMRLDGLGCPRVSSDGDPESDADMSTLGLVTLSVNFHRGPGRWHRASILRAAGASGVRSSAAWDDALVSSLLLLVGSLLLQRLPDLFGARLLRRLCGHRRSLGLLSIECRLRSRGRLAPSHVHNAGPIHLHRTESAVDRPSARGGDALTDRDDVGSSVAVGCRVRDAACTKRRRRGDDLDDLGQFQIECHLLMARQLARSSKLGQLSCL